MKCLICGQEGGHSLLLGRCCWCCVDKIVGILLKEYENEYLKQVKGDNMRIPCNRFKFWWGLSVIRTKGHLLTFAVCLFISGLIVGLSLLLAVQEYQLQALRKLPVNLKGVAYVQEQTETSLETR